MAKVTIHIVCDGGSEVIIKESSAIAIYGGDNAALLVNEAYLKALRTLGMTPDDRKAPPEEAQEA